MKNDRVRAGFVLQLLILLALLWYGRVPRYVLAGAVYLLAASYLGLYCSVSSIRNQFQNKHQESKSTIADANRYALYLSAWQVAMIGVLNIWAVAYSPIRSFVVSYLSAVIFIVASYKLVALADNSDQDGGYKPISFFGLPRSRKLIFLALVYSPIGMLAFAGIVILFAWPRCPFPFQPSQLCLLLAALSSVFSAGLVLQ